MAIESDLKIFLSWSGDLAREVTKVLRAWLPKMFDHVDPWASEVDIEAGTRGLDAIQERLNQSAFGIIIVTTENMTKPWLNFEAGALSRRLDADPTRVVPLLVNFDDVLQLQGPISQFQAIKLTKEGMSGLCRSIASVIGLDALAVAARFDWAWPDLEKNIEAAKAQSGPQPTPPDVDEKQLLANLVQSVRAIDNRVSALTSALPLPKPANESKKKRLSKYSLEADPWTDGDVMQSLQDQIAAIAASFKPVRWVSPVEKNGKRYIGVMFQDGEGLNHNDLNWFMEQAMKFQIPISIETARDAE